VSWRRVGEQLMRTFGLRERVLGGQKALRLGAVSFAFGVFFERVRYRYGPVAQVLTVHGFECGVCCVEAGEIYEGESFRVVCVIVSHDLKNMTFFMNNFSIKKLESTN
jgi:hypothetical protein